MSNHSFLSKKLQYLFYFILVKLIDFDNEDILFIF